MPDVRMPDGTIIRNVPEGTTKAELERRYRAGGARKEKPTSFWQGAAEGILDPAMNAARTVAATNPIMNVANTIGDLFGSKSAPTPKNIIEATRKTARSEFKKAPNRGSTAGRITGGVVGSLPSAFLPGGVLAQGAYGGAMMTENPDDPVGLARDVAIGVVANKLGDIAGRRLIAPVAERVGRTKGAQALKKGVVDTVNKVTGRATQVAPVPVLSATDKAVNRMSPEVESVLNNLQGASDLGLPYSLADASPEMRMLAGSVSRKSPQARRLAEQTFLPRSRGQADRAVQGIDDLLAPITDIKQRSADIIEGGKPVYGPLYDQAYEAPVISSQRLDQILGTPAGREAVGRANTIAANEFRDPRAMGFSVDEAGNPVLNPTRVDLMDDFQAAREGWDAANEVYQEALARQGASLSPGGAISNAVKKAEAELQAAGKRLDVAKSAFEAAPRGGTVAEQSGYTTQSLDYVKRGIDDILEPQRNPITGKLNLDEGGRAINGVQRALLGEVDALNPTYRSAREAYGQYAQQADALRTGFDVLPKGTLPFRDFEAIVSRAAPDNVPEMQRGYATSMADTVNRQRLSINPYDSIYGSPNQQAKVSALFPEGAPKFDRLYNLEGDMAKTTTETLGGSQTQPRAVADQLFDENGAAGKALNIVTNPQMAGLNLIRQRLEDQMRTRGADRASAIAPTLFDTNPELGLRYIRDLIERNAGLQARKDAYGRTLGDLFGITATASAVPALSGSSAR